MVFAIGHQLHAMNHIESLSLLGLFVHWIIRSLNHPCGRCCSCAHSHTCRSYAGRFNSWLSSIKMIGLALLIAAVSLLAVYTLLSTLPPERTYAVGVVSEDA